MPVITRRSRSDSFRKPVARSCSANWSTCSSIPAFSTCSSKPAVLPPSGLGMGLRALLEVILVRGARSLVGHQNGRALGSLRHRFLGLLRFPVRFSLALGHHCLPALASSSVVLARSRGEARKLPKFPSVRLCRYRDRDQVPR